MKIRRKTIIQPLLIAGLFLMAPLWVWGQRITLSGTVTDASTKETLVGASVVVPEDGTGAYTDETGSYTLSIEVKGRQQVKVQYSYTGFAKQTLNIPLDEGNQVRDIRLEPEDFTTEDVVITASKGFEQKQSDVTVSISVMKQEAIDLQATTDVSTAITQIPGIDVLDGQVSIRGSSGFAYGVGSRVMVMMNGLPLLSGDASSVDFRLIPVDNISRIEVVKGASSVLYGSSSLGGVINIITDDAGEKPKTSIRLRGAIYDQPRFKALDWDGDASPYQASAHLFHSRQLNKSTDVILQTDLIKDSGYRQGTDREEFRGMLMWKFRPEHVPGLTLGANVGTRIDSSGATLYWRSYYPDTINGVVSGGALTPTLDGNGARKRLNTRLTIDPYIKYLTPKGNMYWYRGRYLRQKNVNNTNQSNRSSIFYNDFLYQTTLLDKINWVSGLTYTYSTIDSRDLFGGERITAEGDTIFHDGMFSSNSLGLYTQLDGKFGRLNTSLGLRLETVKIDTLQRETIPLLRAGLNYEIARGTNVRLSAGQAFRAPSIAERYTSTTGGGIIVEPNPNIKSEKGFSMELALRQGFRFNNLKFKGQGYIDVAAFRMQYDNMVEFGLKELNIATLSGRFSTTNVANARISGIEVTALGEFEYGPWYFNFSGGVTYIDPVDLDGVPPERQLDLSAWPDNLVKLLIDIQNPEIVDQPRRLKYRTKWTTRASGTLGYKKLSFSTNVRARSFMESIDQFLFIVVNDLQDFRQRHPDGSEVIDFILGYEINPYSRVSVNVNNAFNEEYMIVPGILGEQRSLSVQFKVVF